MAAIRIETQRELCCETGWREREQHHQRQQNVSEAHCESRSKGPHFLFSAVQGLLDL
jgi:hypothetical protein